MNKLSPRRHAFADPTSVEVVEDKNGNIYIRLMGATKAAKISYAVAKVTHVGLVESVPYVPSIEDIVDAK